MAMQIVCSSSIPYAKNAFYSLGDVLVLPPQDITADKVHDADILLVRSTTRVNRALLEGSGVKFVGTATIGTDHMALDYLEQAGIAWCAAPGCNANSVSEYVTAALLCLARRHQFSIEDKIIGVIGVGHVGSLVVRNSEILGLRVIQNDPPRQKAATSAPEAPSGHLPQSGDVKARRQSTEFVSLQQVLEDADIITLHVPLTTNGRYPTFHMADDIFFKKLKPGCILMNTARGAVVDSDALLTAMDKGIVAHGVMDTWEGEPAFRNDILDRMDLATPHIAGYSFEGRVMGTLMVYREVCQYLGIHPSWTPESLLPEPIVPEIALDAAGQKDEAVIWEIIHRVYDIEADDRHLRACSGEDEKKRSDHFEQLRKNYPVRREFRFTRVTLQNSSHRLEKKIRGLGFKD